MSMRSVVVRMPEDLVAAIEAEATRRRASGAALELDTPRSSSLSATIRALLRERLMELPEHAKRP